VVITATGTRASGSTGIRVAFNGVSTVYAQAFTAIRFFGYSGNDNVNVASSLGINMAIVDGGGNNTITIGGGNDTVTAGNGNNTITLGNGNDIVSLGDGTNVVQTGNGTDTITAGGGDNLIAGGLGQHTAHAGNGSNILIDGSVTLTNPGTDSLRGVLDSWISGGASASNVKNIRSRIRVTDNPRYSDTLFAGSGRDWFWATYGLDTIDRKATDLLN
jgi:Ca2+-binding RTX toxin-like protein